MEIKNSEKLLDSLVINKVPSRKIYNQMVKQGKVNNDEIYIVNKEDDLPYKYSFTAQEGDTTFTFPFTVENPDDLNIFFNGLLITKNVNYSIENNTITLLDFTAEAGDNIVALNVRGIDPDEYSSNMIDNLNMTIETLDNKVAKLPANMDELMRTTKTNTMVSGAKITMANEYNPSTVNDVSTKGYVDQQILANKITKTSQLANDSGFLTNHLVSSVNGMIGNVSIKGAYINSYIGDGTSLTKTFTFNFEPALFILIRAVTNRKDSMISMLIINGMPYPYSIDGGFFANLKSTWSNNSITLTASTSNVRDAIQGSNYTYYYMAIPKFNN